MAVATNSHCKGTGGELGTFVELRTGWILDLGPFLLILAALSFTPCLVSQQTEVSVRLWASNASPGYSALLTPSLPGSALSWNRKHLFSPVRGTFGGGRKECIGKALATAENRSDCQSQGGVLPEEPSASLYEACRSERSTDTLTCKRTFSFVY